MKLNLDSFRKDHYLIKACSPLNIQVNDLNFDHSIVVSLSQAPRSWPVTSIDKLTARDIEFLLQTGEPELVLIGTGARHIFPPAETIAPLLIANIGYEIMDTAAACRTYNILAAEGRLVVAGLIMPT